MDYDFGAFQLLEACMNNCGKRFQTEVAKFRFLNELIKVLSPKVRDRMEASPQITRQITMIFNINYELQHLIDSHGDIEQM